MSVCDYSIEGWLKGFADVTITEFKRKVFCYLLKYYRHRLISESTHPRSWIGESIKSNFKYFFSI